MFVVSSQGYLHGPFETANDAAQFGGSERRKDMGPWSIVPIKPPPEIVDQVSINDTEGVKRVLKAVAGKRKNVTELRR
jgi:hypothetical protein